MRPRCARGNQCPATFTHGGHPPAWNQPFAKASASITPSTAPAVDFSPTALPSASTPVARVPTTGAPASQGAAANRSVATAEPTIPMPRMRRAPNRSVSCPLTSCPVAYPSFTVPRTNPISSAVSPRASRIEWTAGPTLLRHR